MALVSTVQNILPYLVNSVDPVLLKRLGYARKDMIIRCTYDTEKCREEQFIDFSDPTFGNCYSFNGHGELVAYKTGEEYGNVA